MANNPVITFKIKGDKIIKAELYPDIAPNTVNNFISLVKNGFYNGLTFHRIIEGFMMQGGDPLGRDAPLGHQDSLRTEGRPRTGTEGRVAPSASVCHAAGWGISRSPLRTLVNWARPTRSFLPHP